MISTRASVFEKVLHAFETGDLAYSDVLDQLQRVLANGAAPEELSDILRRRESIAPLPPSAHKGILAVLNDALERPAASPTSSIVAREPDAPVAPSSIFDKVLDTFETGGFTYADVLDQLERLLGSGASPSSLLATMRRRELIDPLPQYAHVQIMGRLHDAIRHSEMANAPTTGPAATLQPPAESTVAERAAAVERGKAEEAMREALREAKRHEAELRTLREALKVREGQLVALQREHARVVPELQVRAQAAAQLGLDMQELRARAVAHAAELEAARTALEAERTKTRSVGAALAERIAASEQDQQRVLQAAREVERQQHEARAARAAEIAARDAALAERDAQAGDLSARLGELDAQLRDLSARLGERDAQLRDLGARLAERDAQLGSLQTEHARLVSALEMRTRASAAVDAERQAARERTAALTTELASAREALDTERNRSRELAAALAASQASTAAAKEQRDQARHQAELHQGESLKLREALAAARASGTAPAAPSAPAARASSGVSAVRTAAAPAAVSAGPGPDAPGKAGVRTLAAAGRPWVLGVAVLVVACVLWFVINRTKAPVPVPPRPAAVLPAAGTVIQDCATCPAMTVIAPGKFRQGAARVEGSSSFEQPLHAVLISRPFAMSRNAVTVDDFRQFVTATQWDMQGCDTYDGAWKHVADADWQSPGYPQTGTHPVTCVSWNDAERYAQWLSTRTGHHYRLPSASEWEYVARVGGEAAEPWSSKGTDACEHANVADQSAARRYPGWTAFPCDDGFVYTAPGGSFKANAFGLNDLLGNVFQWTEDCWHPDYRGAPIDGSARTDGDCSEHELRGGSWFTNPSFVRANYRNHFAADYRTSTVGVRLVRDLQP